MKVYVVMTDRECGKYIAFSEDASVRAESWTSANDAVGAVVRILATKGLVDLDVFEVDGPEAAPK